MGLNRSEGGTDKAARLPKGWTGPVSKSGTQAAKAAWVFLCADKNRRRRPPGEAHITSFHFAINQINQLPKPPQAFAVESELQPRQRAQVGLVCLRRQRPGQFERSFDKDVLELAA